MVIVFGSINADLIVAVTELPKPGETVLGSDLRIEPGGKGANQALAAARAGARVVFAGAVGDDPLARPALRFLREASVDLTRIKTVSRITGAAAITVDARGRNQIAVASGANRLARATQVEDALLDRNATLLLQLESEPAEVIALIERAHARAARTILNLAPPRELPIPTLSLVDILLVNESEARVLAARLGCAPTARAMGDRLGTGVVCTLGEAGAEAWIGGQSLRLPASAVTVVDTTAAGDCFAGVLAAFLDRGSAPAEALERAVIAAGLACTREGSQGSMPTLAEINAACDAADRPYNA